MKYENVGNVGIFVNINDDYDVYAIGNCNKEECTYTLYLKRKDIGMLSVIEKQENINIKSSYKTVKTDLLKIISKLHKDNFFNYYINRFEYEQKCFDYGDDYYNKEMIGE